MARICSTVIQLKEEFPLLGVAFGNALLSPISDTIPNIVLEHDCDDVSGLGTSNPNKKTCKCSVLQIILRIFGKLKPSCQESIKNLIVSQFCYYPFKIRFAVDFLNMANFAINWQGKQISQNMLGDLNVQVLTSEELSYLAIKEVGLTSTVSGIHRIMNTFVKNSITRIKLADINPIDGIDDPKNLDSDTFWIDNEIHPSIHLDNKFTFGCFHNLHYALMKRKGILEFLSQKDGLK